MCSYDSFYMKALCDIFFWSNRRFLRSAGNKVLKGSPRESGGIFNLCLVGNFPGKLSCALRPICDIYYRWTIAWLLVFLTVVWLFEAKIKFELIFLDATILLSAREIPFETRKKDSIDPFACIRSFGWTESESESIPSTIDVRRDK